MMFEKPIDSFTGEFDFLSNFFDSPYILDGVWFQTVEHGYQSEKALTEAEKDFIRSAGTPGQAKRQTIRGPRI
jgi:predicted NAD-dependent protein-ADP-ribosyltransferase YbiA (DUF1768 family)